MMTPNTKDVMEMATMRFIGNLIAAPRMDNQSSMNQSVVTDVHIIHNDDPVRYYMTTEKTQNKLAGGR